MLSGESLREDVGLVVKVKVRNGFSWGVLKSLLDGSLVLIEIMSEEDNQNHSCCFETHIQTQFPKVSCGVDPVGLSQET